MNKIQLDVRQKICPLPVIETQAAIDTLAAGDEITVIATDPTTEQDIPAWCRIHGHQLKALRVEGVERILLYKSYE